MNSLTSNKIVLSVAFVVLAVAIILFSALANMNTVSSSGIYIHVQRGHAFEDHGAQVNEAFKCMQRNGSKTVMSEKLTRNLHWICLDPITNVLYDIITTFLTKTIEHPAGEATLITAYAPSNYLGISDELTTYIANLSSIKEAIIVGLRAFPGNIFFGP